MNDPQPMPIERLLELQEYALVESRSDAAGHTEMVLRRSSRTYLGQWHPSPSAVVGIAAVQLLCDAIRLPRIEGGLIVTRGQFAADAVRLALNHPVELVDGETLAGLLRAASPEPQRGPACPNCGAPTVERGVREASRSKPFWGCSRFPDCRGVILDPKP